MKVEAPGDPSYSWKGGGGGGGKGQHQVLFISTDKMLCGLVCLEGGYGKAPAGRFAQTWE